MNNTTVAAGAGARARLRAKCPPLWRWARRASSISRYGDGLPDFFFKPKRTRAHPNPSITSKRQSHHNYGLLALAAEKVTGQDIHALIRQRVLTPLGMVDTDLVVPTTQGDRVGSSFKWSGKRGFRPIPQGGRFDASHGRPRAVGGSAYSTAVDMAK